MIYTSYFAQIRNFPSNLVGLSTAVFNPKWLHPGKSQNGILWLDIPPLKPGHSCNGLCSGHCNPKHPHDCEFLKQYRIQLDNINFNEFLIKLNKLKEKIENNEHLNDIDFALLVYEVPTNPCSERVVIQDWFKANNLEIQEWHK